MFKAVNTYLFLKGIYYQNNYNSSSWRNKCSVSYCRFCFFQFLWCPHKYSLHLNYTLITTAKLANVMSFVYVRPGGTNVPCHTADSVSFNSSSNWRRKRKRCVLSFIQQQVFDFKLLWMLTHLCMTRIEVYIHFL
jgi:hypothetical protein